MEPATSWHRQPGNRTTRAMHAFGRRLQVPRWSSGHHNNKRTPLTAVITTMAQYFNALADIGDDDLGALGLFRRRKRKRKPAARGMPARMLIPSVPGVPSRGLREQPLPLGSTSFTASSGTALPLSATPARPFRGRRLILDTVRNGTTGGLVNITSLNVGADNQLPVPSGTAMPAAAFAANAVGVNLDMDPAGPGVGVFAQVSITAAPTMTDTVDVSGLIIGSTVG